MKSQTNDIVKNSGFLQNFDKQIQGAFKDYFRTKIKIVKEFTCVNTQEAQNTKIATFLGMSCVF